MDTLVPYKTTNNIALRQKIEKALRELIPVEPRTLYDPIREMIALGGKRVRPMLTVLAASLGDNASDNSSSVMAGCAVELLHSFTLAHDDIMDNAATRRGQSTMHVTHGTNTAILSGDAMIALACEALVRTNSSSLQEMLREFSIGFRAVCEGQALDKEFETRDDITIDEYIEMIDLKTAKILELSAVLGALVNDGSYKEELRAFAHHLGIAFQIKDDLLDLTADHPQFGKTIGGDILEGKRTLLFVSAMERYSALSEADRTMMNRISKRNAVSTDIPEARELFKRMGILDAAASIAEQHTSEAVQNLAHIPDSPEKQSLLDFAKYLLERAT